MTLQATPLTLKNANAFVAEHHRHNKPVVGHRFSIGAVADQCLVGVAIVGRPISRNFDYQEVAEVLRLCVMDASPKNTCSFLYGACWRAWKAMGGRRIITYTLARESGASLRGAGWVRSREISARNQADWTNRGGNRVPQLVVGEAKIRWEAGA
jgi:hypothetical protein